MLAQGQRKSAAPYFALRGTTHSQQQPSFHFEKLSLSAAEKSTGLSQKFAISDSVVALEMAAVQNGRQPGGMKLESSVDSQESRFVCVMQWRYCVILYERAS